MLLQEETVKEKHKYSNQLGGDDKQKVEYSETQVKKLQKDVKQLEVQLQNVQVCRIDIRQLANKFLLY